MKIVPQITIRDLPNQSKALEYHIQQKINKLDNFYDNITQCEVVVKQIQKHQRRGKKYQININLTVPNGKFTVNHHQHENVYIAIRDAFKAMTRKLQSYARQRRGQVKHHEIPLHGRIVRIFPQQQFGFIEADGTEYYFTPSNINHFDFNALEAGMEVQFLTQSADEGLQANRVTLDKPHKHAAA